jgi:hypothetical protein
MSSQQRTDKIAQVADRKQQAAIYLVQVVSQVLVVVHCKSLGNVPVFFVQLQKDRIVMHKSRQRSGKRGNPLTDRQDRLASNITAA